MDGRVSTRAYNCLRTGKVISIGHLVQKQERDLLKIRNMGRKTLNEIKTVLGLMGLELGMKLPPDLESTYSLY